MSLHTSEVLQHDPLRLSLRYTLGNFMKFWNQLNFGKLFSTPECQKIAELMHLYRLLCFVSVLRQNTHYFFSRKILHQT